MLGKDLNLNYKGLKAFVSVVKVGHRGLVAMTPLEVFASACCLVMCAYVCVHTCMQLRVAQPDKYMLIPLFRRV